jgi:hypothetical protein
MPRDYEKIYIEFENACKSTPNRVFLINNVLDDADRYYKLKTEKALLGFIANGGLEGRSFDKKKPWENNFTKNKPLFVYAYFFLTNKIPGYIAIIKNVHSNNWFIKSFHPPKHQPKEITTKLAGPLKALGLKSSEEK